MTSSKAEARAIYKSDASEVRPGTIVRSVDLQKVIMLPTLPGVKSACFTKRIVAFHETFAPVDKYKIVTPTFSCIWHEGTSGRKAEDIASTFVHSLRQDRDETTIIYFSDNCSAQNKNWYLFSELANIINSDEISAETVTVKFLETGHTFMSADSIHADVEKRMKAKKDICDFDDFRQCIEHKNVIVKTLAYSDFYTVKNFKSTTQVQRAGVQLAEMRVVQFRCNDRCMYYKKRHTDGDYEKLDFLMKKFKLPYTLQPSRDSPGCTAGFHGGINGGIPLKDDIIKNLVPLMPVTRHPFCLGLHTDDASVDLISGNETDVNQ